MVCIDSQSIKVAPFIQQDIGIDGNKKVNGRKQHLLVDTLGLIWAVVVHAARRRVLPLEGAYRLGRHRAGGLAFSCIVVLDSERYVRT